ncbi:molybdopterin-guanine dinucleotide biosynthesis protein B [Roseibium sp. CAU 1637]|uniref:Molybdopterin-guanine dinucleotide biosynthesis protein B n=1 Tax=Roseibium limicola TaxID=2816037 RepID=A0A939J8N3_9HYPH|nr:molybdopterin-guanine dinucleotide biosynthesis protein B [Roseibium limicola]MBO0345054.1 molybdopterin-guanine dinucleotide biosynthesis protein B [Roseibium limicola]
MTTPPIFGVTGWKNSGKTQLVTALVSALTARGLKVSTVKHAHHAFDVDTPGTDSYRHREAGASEVALVSGRRWALMHELREDDEPPLTDILKRLSPCDLVLIEGYKRESHPKIEARRLGSTKDTPLSDQDPAIQAIAADHPVAETHLPVFDLNDISAIADFICQKTGLKTGT